MAEITWKSILTKLVGGDHLSAEESEWFVDDLMNGNADPAAVGAVLATQQQLGLTPDEVRGAAKAGSKSFRIPFDRQGLADHLNLDRSALSKELGKMRDEGILETTKNEFTLHELPE